MTNGNGLGVKISVIGVGGAGCNAVNTMVDDRNREGEEKGSIFSEVQIIAANTDAQDLDSSSAEKKIQLGPELTKGNGAGSKPDVGRESAEESQVDVAQILEGTEMLFVTAGMGGGTGTGAAPVIASVARKNKILTVGVVTLPFHFEGRKKMKIAMAGIEELQENLDTLVVIPNEKLLENATEDLGTAQAFELSNEVLLDAVKNIALLISKNGLVNVDFEDVRTTMTEMGVAMIGFGTATGENAALMAVQSALGNSLLSDLSIDGAERALLYLDGMTPTLKELAAATSYVEEKLSEDADFIWGVSDGDNSDKVHALVVASAKTVGRKKLNRSKPMSAVQPVQQPLFADPEQSDIDKIIGNLQSDKPAIEKEMEVEFEVEDDIPLRPAAKKESTMSLPETVHEHGAEVDGDTLKVPAILRKGKNSY